MTATPTVCIGWPGDCNAWGPNTGMHGCRLATEHHGDHQCLCGATDEVHVRKRPPRPRRTRRAS